MRTRITGRWVIGYRNGSHCIVPRGEVVYEDDTIVYVGSNYEGNVDRAVDATDHLVAPGFVDLDCPVTLDPRLFRVDGWSRGFEKPAEFWSGPDHALSQSQLRAVARYSVSRGLRMGSTTVRATTEPATDRWNDPKQEPPIVAESMSHVGVRGYVAPQFRSVPWRFELEGAEDRTDYHTNRRGTRALDRAVEFVESTTDINRVHGHLALDAVETCSLELLRKVKREANRLGVRIAISYGGGEVGTSQGRGQTNGSAIDCLKDVGVLDRNLVLTLDPVRGTTGEGRWPDAGELGLLAKRGVTLTLVPQVGALRGAFVDSISRFEDHGLSVALGTGTFPPDPIAVMRCGSAAGKAVEQRADTAHSRAVFNAATLGGANALSRNDIGRLAPGAKADIVSVDFARAHVGYVHDPIRALVNHCYGSDVDQVVVGGETMVANGEVSAIDSPALAEEVRGVVDALAPFLDAQDVAERYGGKPFDRSYPIQEDDR